MNFSNSVFGFSKYKARKLSLKQPAWFTVMQFGAKLKEEKIPNSECSIIEGLVM
jgi:hypothetical protein